ncbi:MAG TPA: FAD:protein FMN transferase [Spirochaetales bacterium]|nr:FAD:protein FMN transferase [Spirochaetales bacterium]
MTHRERLICYSVISLVLLFVLCVTVMSCQAQPLTRTDFILGTVCSIKFLHGGNQKLLDECFVYLRQLDDAVSANKEGTYIDAINKSAGREAIQVPEEVLELIAAALQYAERSNGAFDPTVGPLVKLWGIGTDAQRVPAPQELQAACALINWRDVVVNTAERTVYLKRSGMRLDLGAIAKGWASEHLAGMLRAAHVTAIIDLGGNIQLVGQKPNKKPWKVGVQNPFGERNNSITILTLDKPMAVITSGVYERYFIENDKRYHHILDVESGYPVDNGLVSVTIIADSGIQADALSTTLFVLGIEKGLALAEQEGVEAIFIDAGHRVYTTPGARLLITDGLDEEFSFGAQ